MKEHPDINDTLRTEGEDAARARHDKAPRYKSNGTGGAADDRVNFYNGGGTRPGPKAPETPDAKWPVIDNAAFYGVVGEIVQTIEPHTESDRVALLIQTLVAAGNVIGRSRHYRVESDQHRANIFAVLVGDSSKGRKGTSWGRIRSIAKSADERGNRVMIGRRACTFSNFASSRSSSFDTASF
jgi:hypothetical protein